MIGAFDGCRTQRRVHWVTGELEEDLSVMERDSAAGCTLLAVVPVGKNNQHFSSHYYSGTSK